MGSRYYHPGLGRFTIEDTLTGSLSNPLSQNRYGYGEADPLSVSDPSGTRVECEGPCPDHGSFKLESHFSGRLYYMGVDHGAGLAYPRTPPVTPPPALAPTATATARPEFLPTAAPVAAPAPGFVPPNDDDPWIFEAIDAFIWHDIYICATRTLDGELRGAAGSCAMILPWGKVGKLGKLGKYGDDVLQAGVTLTARAVNWTVDDFAESANKIYRSHLSAATRSLQKHTQQLDRISVFTLTQGRAREMNEQAATYVAEILRSPGRTTYMTHRSQYATSSNSTTTREEACGTPRTGRSSASWSLRVDSSPLGWHPLRARPERAMSNGSPSCTLSTLSCGPTRVAEMDLSQAGRLLSMKLAPPNPRGRVA
jgi:hypothetical protein